MKKHFLQLISKKLTLIGIGVAIFVAGGLITTNQLSNKPVTFKSTADDSSQGVTNPNSPKVVPTDPASTAGLPSVQTPATTPTVTPSDTPQSDSDSLAPQAVQTPPAPTLVSEVIVNDSVTQNGNTWQETASCLYTYSDGSTNTVDLGVIFTKSAAFTSQNEGRACNGNLSN